MNNLQTLRANLPSPSGGALEPFIRWGLSATSNRWKDKDKGSRPTSRLFRCMRPNGNVVHKCSRQKSASVRRCALPRRTAAQQRLPAAMKTAAVHNSRSGSIQSVPASALDVPVAHYDTHAYPPAVDLPSPRAFSQTRRSAPTSTSTAACCVRPESNATRSCAAPPRRNTPPNAHDSRARGNADHRDERTPVAA